MAKRPPRKTAAGRGASSRGDRPKLPAPMPRLSQVEDWLGIALSHGDVVKLATTTFGISVRTAERDIDKIYSKWEKEDEGDRPAKRARMRGELWDLYHESRRLMKLHEEGQGDDVETEGGSMAEGAVVATVRVRKRRLPRPKDCLDSARILERLCKLDGLDAPTTVHVSGGDPLAAQIAGMTPAAQAKELKLLLDDLAKPPDSGPEPTRARPQIDPSEYVRKRR